MPPIQRFNDSSWWICTANSVDNDLFEFHKSVYHLDLMTQEELYTDQEPETGIQHLLWYNTFTNNCQTNQLMIKT